MSDNPKPYAYEDLWMGLIYVALCLYIACSSPTRPKYDPQTGAALTTTCWSPLMYSTHVQCREIHDIGGGAGYLYVLRDCRLFGPISDGRQFPDIKNAVNIIQEDCLP